jgi:hypothetical protein
LNYVVISEGTGAGSAPKNCDHVTILGSESWAKRENQALNNGPISDYLHVS